MSELPLFPLHGVLLPNGRMPLQIFEPRYLDLVRDCLKHDTAFGVVWIRRGSEVAERGRAAAELGDWGCYARIVDWDQLPNGLLGVTIEGAGRFDLYDTRVEANGLVVGRIEDRPMPPPVPMAAQWQSMLDVLQSLEIHPHVQRLGMQVDHGDARQVAWGLAQLLPLDEALKYQWLGLDDAELLLSQLDRVLNQISGQD